MTVYMTKNKMTMFHIAFHVSWSENIQGLLGRSFISSDNCSCVDLLLMFLDMALILLIVPAMAPSDVIGAGFSIFLGGDLTKLAMADQLDDLPIDFLEEVGEDGSVFPIVFKLEPGDRLFIGLSAISM